MLDQATMFTYKLLRSLTGGKWSTEICMTHGDYSNKLHRSGKRLSWNELVKVCPNIWNIY